MTQEKVIADSSGVLVAALGYLLTYAQVSIGIFMLIGGAILLTYRLIIARKENRIADLEIKKLEKETQGI